MEENARYAVGVDIGTNTVRAVMGKFGKDGSVSVVGYGEAPSEGIRRGRVKELSTPPKAIDACLKAVEAMSGINVNSATVGINGSHIGSTKIDGMIAVGVADHEIDADINDIRYGPSALAVLYLCKDRCCKASYDSHTAYDKNECGLSNVFGGLFEYRDHVENNTIRKHSEEEA